MEILNNFASIYCYISFVIGAVFMLAMLSIAAMGKVKEPRNKVRFYVTKTIMTMIVVLFGWKTCLEREYSIMGSSFKACTSSV